MYHSNFTRVSSCNKEQTDRNSFVTTEYRVVQFKTLKALNCTITVIKIMRYPNILLWGNNTFHMMDSWDDNKVIQKFQPKYLQIGISGTIDSTRVLTYDEIMIYTDNKAIACKDMLEINTIYFSTK